MWNKFRSKSRATRQSSTASSNATLVDSRGRKSSTLEVQPDFDRSPSPRSTLSSHIFPTNNLNLPNRLREKSKERHADPLGLSVVYDPKATRSADIIFVHGLGGTSYQTWSKNRDQELFWPGRWLPLDSDISTARILSFGYNAYFMSTGPSSVLNISDFAKDLLYEMRFGRDDNLEDLGIGKVPIMFVVHSMGGLVVKKAYILGQNDENYRDIITATRVILFLSTPHRGTNLAEVLNRILSVSIFNHTPKQYIAELKRNSPALEDINEQFRHIAPNLQIMSFFETLQTPIGPSSVMVLEKDSSILGYPSEISKSMVADHHDICKYTSVQDPNYINVRNALKTFVAQIYEEGKELRVNQTDGKDEKIAALLAISESPIDDHNFFLGRWMPGTCEWILSQKIFYTWIQKSAASSFLWLHGLPASGKSIMSAFLINHLREVLGVDCQYYFFRFGDQTKRSINSLLRSLAFQIAEQIPEFRKALRSIFSDGVRLEKTDARTIWHKLFASILFKLDIDRPIYWVLDAVDESDSPQLLPEILRSISSSRVPIRVMVVSRQSSALSSAFDRLASSVTVDIISARGNLNDIRIYVEREMQDMHGGPEFIESVVQRILERASGNFLWVHLALKEILQCHTQEDIEQALENLPAGMESLYQRMESNVARSNRAADIKLAKRLLVWTICSRRPLNLDELSQALQPEFPIFLDLKHTISQVCGHFVIVDSKEHVVLVHQTAREYLTRTPNLRCGVDLTASHEELLSRCVLSLLEPALRRMIEQPVSPGFISYSATSWAYHLNLSDAGSEESLTHVNSFLEGYSVLIWIHYLAKSKQLTALAYASQALALFAHRKRRLDSSKIPTLRRLKELETIELWATDLAKLLGKFGANLLEDPVSIYKLIPHFCPKSSAVYRQFGREVAHAAVEVSGISNITWDDSIARLSVRDGEEPVKVIASGRYFVVLTFHGTLVIWDAISFEPKFRLAHQEHVTTMCFSHDNNMLASCGLQSTKIWKLSSGRQIHCLPNPQGCRALGVSFTSDDSVILMGSDDRNVRRLSFSRTSDGWQIIDSRILREESLPNGYYHNSPCCMVFSPDTTQIAVAYRGLPLSVWKLDNPALVKRCRRNAGHRRKISNAWTGADRVVWHPTRDEVLGLYNDGCVFKWNPLNEETQELYANASELACSLEGTVFATSDVDGNVKIYNYQHFALIYQLSWEMPVVDITFSPDSRRFYDIRGPICNVWEPNVLIRLSDTDERGSDTASDAGSTTLASMASETCVDLVNPIMALAVPDCGHFYCTGSDEGIVHLFDNFKGKKLELWRSSSLMTVQHLVWSPGAKGIASAEVGGKINVKSVIVSGPESKISKWIVNSIANFEVQVESGGINQLLLDPLSQYLLISSQTSAQVWSLNQCSIAALAMSKKPSVSQQWINYPNIGDRLLACNSESLTIYRWDNLAELSTIQIDTSIKSSIGQQSGEDGEVATPLRRSSLGNPLSPPESDLSIDKFMVTQDKEHILLQMSEHDSIYKSTKQLYIFDIALLESAVSQALSVLKPLSIPQEILSRIEIPLGILPKQRLVFLDRDYWMCTWGLNSCSKLTEHFFLPRDWINPESLKLCSLMEEGAFLYPRNGEVAVIRCGLESSDLLNGQLS